MLALTCAVTSGSCSAETLPQAIQSALANNAALAQAKAKQRSLEQQVPLARAGGLPSVAVNSELLDNREPLLASFSNPARRGDADLNINIPLYSGGAVKHAIGAARWAARQGADLLLSSKTNLLINVVTAYVGLLAARRNLEIDRAYLNELEESLNSTNIRFAAGELTKTDINQVKTALSAARVTYLGAVSSVRAQEAQYAYFVGHEPGDLSPPPPLPTMPRSESEAVGTALKSNSDISSAAKGVRAARERTKAALASRLPRLQAFGTGDYTNFLGAATNIFGAPEQQVHKTAQFGLIMTLPIFQGGAATAKIRDARAQEDEAVEGARDTNDSVVSLVRSGFAQFEALTSEEGLAQDQISTAEEAYRGVKLLNRLGDRNSQDVLNADQSVLAARSQAIGIGADRYAAAITLLGRMGILAGADDKGWILSSDTVPADLRAQRY